MENKTKIKHGTRENRCFKYSLSFRLQASGFRLQASGFRLQASGLGLQQDFLSASICGWLFFALSRLRAFA
jgi:hypothetical protein